MPGLWVELEHDNEPCEHEAEGLGLCVTKHELREAGPEVVPQVREQVGVGGGGGAAEAREDLEQQVIVQGADAQTQIKSMAVKEWQ